MTATVTSEYVDKLVVGDAALLLLLMEDGRSKMIHTEMIK